MKTTNQENEFINSFVRIYQNWRFFIVLFLWSLPVLVNAQTQLGITASVIPINTNHPAAIPTEYSGCFDKFTLRLDISNFLRAATVNSSTPQITLTMPSYVQLSNENLIYGSGNTTNPGSAISLNVAQLSYPHNFNLTPIISITPANVNCAGEPFTLNANAAPCNGCTYLWNTNPPNTTNSISQIATTTTQFYLTVNNQGCIGQSSYLLNVDESCCIIPSYIPLNQSDFNQLSGTSLKKISPGNYTLSKDVVVNGFVLIEPGTIIKISADKTITIPDGSTLYIEGKSHLSACSNTTWNGIIAEPGSTLEIHSGGVPSAQVTIEDAKIAVNAWMDLAASKLTRIAIDHDVIFNKNNVGLFLHDGDFHNSSFSGITFKCDAPMLAPFQTGNPIDTYSQRHVDLQDAVNVNFISPRIGGNPCLNFEDARVGIFCERSNLKVRNARFVRGLFPNKRLAYGIYASGLSPNFAQPTHTLEVGNATLSGWITSGGIASNSFDEFYYGVAVYNNYNATIQENQFSNSIIGAGLGSNNNKTIFIRANKFDDFTAFGVIMENNNSSLCYVQANYFNAGSNLLGKFDLLTESRKAIYVNNIVKASSNLVVSANRVWNARHGIHIANHKGGVVMANEIHFDIPNGDIVGILKRKGIISQANTNLNIFSNSITRNCSGCTTTSAMSSTNGSGDYYLIGITQDMSEGVIQENTVVNLPTACRIYWNCFNTTLRCNYFDNNLEGYRLDNAVLMTQGDANHPTGNEWVTNATQFGNRVIGSTNNGTSVDWYFDPSLGADYDPTVNTTVQVFSPLQSNVGTYPNCIDNNPCIGCEQLRIYQSLLDSGYTYYQNENLYLNQQRAYQRLSDSLQLLYSGTTYDVPLQTFFTVMALGNVGLIEDVREYLEHRDLANALIQSQSINPAVLIEYNTCMVDEICISGSQGSDTLVYDDGRKNDLMLIAYQLPIFGGEAVYRARAILKLDVDDTQLSYRLHSQLLSISNKYKIYPVPNKGIFTILKTNQDENPIGIDVYDLQEKLIASASWLENTNELKVSLQGAAPGVYLVQVTSLDGSIENLKTIITP